jgi:hypothetical protein
MTEIQRKTRPGRISTPTQRGQDQKRSDPLPQTPPRPPHLAPALHDHTHASSPTATTHQHHHRRRSGPHAMHPLKPANSDPPSTEERLSENVFLRSGPAERFGSRTAAVTLSAPVDLLGRTGFCCVARRRPRTVERVAESTRPSVIRSVGGVRSVMFYVQLVPVGLYELPWENPAPRARRRSLLPPRLRRGRRQRLPPTAYGLPK